MSDVLSSPPAVWSVSELNRAVKGLVEREFSLLWVAGEISNLTIAASGHCYFSLKDGGGQVRCVMFRNRAMLLPFKPREGLKVEARVTATLYEARGDFQLNVESMRPAGLGALYEAFERLKAKLAAEGLFDVSRKRDLPNMPRAIGIVTSPQAAALRDVLTTLRRRAPHVPVVLYPTPVQGEGAADRIAAMIAVADRRREVDVLIVCRGGGSIEDLWAFNEEVVARAIGACGLPIVSGVGHETDVTIADFAADLRAATPTAAAELVSPDRAALLAMVATAKTRLDRLWWQQWRAAAQRLDYVGRRLVHPGERLRRRGSDLAAAQQRLAAAQLRLFERLQWRLERMQARVRKGRPDLEKRQARLDRRAMALGQGGRQILVRRRLALETAKARLEAMNPHAVLARGYSVVTHENGKVVTDASQLRFGEVLSMSFAVGTAAAVVSDKPVSQGKLFDQAE
jgi:exodeoxyribonuclease VII large subunit